MYFLVLIDGGTNTVPIEATNLADLANQIKQQYGQGTGQHRISLMLPAVTGRLIQNPDPAQATIQMTGDSLAQKQIRDNLATFLGVPSPTNAQVVAAVRALARLVVGDFTATT